MLWGCPGLPHVLAPEAYPALPRPLWSGPAQGRKPGYRHPCCTPAPCPPRAPPLVSTPPQLCKSDPTLSRVLGAAGPLVRCPQGSSEAWPHPPVLTSLLDLVAHSVQPRILTAWAGCCVGTPQVVLMPWTPTHSPRPTLLKLLLCHALCKRCSLDTLAHQCLMRCWPCPAHNPKFS